MKFLPHKAPMAFKVQPTKGSRFQIISECRVGRKIGAKRVVNMVHNAYICKSKLTKTKYETRCYDAGLVVAPQTLS